MAKEADPPAELIGKFVVVCGDVLFGPCRTYSAAVRLGRKMAGNDTFHVLRLDRPKPPDKKPGH